MRTRRPNGKELAYMVAAALCFPGPAYGYVDPNAGSIFLQLLLGGFAGLATLGTILARRLRQLWKMDRQKKEKP